MTSGQSRSGVGQLKGLQVGPPSARSSFVTNASATTAMGGKPLYDVPRWRTACELGGKCCAAVQLIGPSPSHCHARVQSV